VTATTLKTYLSEARAPGGRKNRRKAKAHRPVGTGATATAPTTESKRAVEAHAAIARHPELPHRLAHERRNDAEVLGDDPRPGDRLRRARQLVEHHAEDAASPRALPLSAGRVEATAVDAVSAPDPLPEVADHVIEAEAVVEAGRVAGAHPDPREIVALHREPVVRRESPVLPVGGEIVGRRPERELNLKLRGMRPHVGALAPHDEGQVAHQLD